MNFNVIFNRRQRKATNQKLDAGLGKTRLCALQRKRARGRIRRVCLQEGVSWKSNWHQLPHVQNLSNKNAYLPLTSLKVS